MEPETTRNELKQRRALRAVLEWLTSDDYAVEARWETVLRTLTVWKEVQAVDWSEKQPEEEHQKQRTFEETRDALRDSGWFRGERRTVGRPRTRDFTAQEEHRAERKLNWAVWNRSERTEKDLARVAGYAQPSSVWVVTLTDNVWRDLLTHATAELVEGKTRDELTAALNLNRNTTASFVRYLLENGWRESRVRTPEGRKRVLTQKA